MNTFLKTSFASVIFLLTMLSQGFGQSQVVKDASPIGGLDAVALSFLKVNFTKEQRDSLKGKPIEVILTISPQGVPTIEKINGVTDLVLLDSLQGVTRRLPRFTPRSVDGVPEPSLYFFQFQYPTYLPATASFFSFSDVHRYNQAKYEDFATVQLSGQRMDILFGGVANTFMGSAGSYLRPGGGMKMEITYTGRKGLGGALLMSFYGNSLKKDYPIASTREQNSAPPTLLVGLGLHKILRPQARNHFMVQLEANMALHNVTAKEDYKDEDFTQLMGFSPGLVGHYLLQLGKPKSYVYYGQPSMYKHYLNLHAGVRPVFYDLKEASGVMLELGLSYRLGVHLVESFTYK